jgi:hypothetical protein
MRSAIQQKEGKQKSNRYEIGVPHPALFNVRPFYQFPDQRHLAPLTTVPGGGIPLRFVAKPEVFIYSQPEMERRN